MLAVALAVLVCPVSARAAAAPPIRHVWVINLENWSVCVNPANDVYASVSPERVGCPTPSFAAGAAYLGKILPAEGTMVENYFGIGHESLDNYIAEVSGQAPNPDTQADCPAPADLTPGTFDAAQQQAIGQGCYFPARVKTIPDQLRSRGLTWKGYMEDMGNDQAKDAVRPAATGLGALTRSGTNCSLSNRQGFGGSDNYVAKHDPFVWFHSITDNQAYCDAHVVPLSGLRPDLQRIATTPNLSFITPNMDDDGHDTFPPGAPSPWAAYWVRQIMASPAYRQDGMIIIVYDENSDSGVAGAPVNGNILSSCCGQIPGPNSPSPGAFGDQGGGETGAWIISPYVAPGVVSAANSYNHYSLLRSLEDLFGITTGGADGQGHLGYAAGNGVTPNSVVGFRSFGCDDIFTVVCPPMAGQVSAQPAPAPSPDVGPRLAEGSIRWLNPAPQGNDLNAVSCSTQTSCVAVGGTGAIVTTGDSGSSWSSRSSGTTADLNGVSCPASGRLCVAVGSGGTVLTSGDGGGTWSPASSGTQQDLNGVSCPNATVCYVVGDYGTILASTDGGASWSGETSPTQHDLAQITCPDAGHCYVTGDFQVVPASEPPLLGNPATVAGDLLVTGDGGRAWTATTPSRYAGRYRGLACTDRNDCVAGDEHGGSFPTSDGFQTATQQGFTSEPLLGASCVAGACVLVGMRGQIVRTAGPNLVETQTLSGGFDLHGVSCPSASACYAVGRGGVIVTSDDAGTKWTRSGADSAASNLATNFGFNFESYGGQTIGSLDLAGASCPTASSCVAVGFLGAILTSSDGGGSWSARGGFGAPGANPFNALIHGTPAPIPESTDAHPLDAVSCSGASSCVAVGELGKVMTTSNLGEGGGNWSSHDSGTANRLTAVSCPSETGTCFAVGDYGTILKSTDGGASWSSQKSGTSGFLNGISCADRADCVAVGSQGLILTTNDGSTWAEASSPTSAYLAAVSCPNKSRCLAVGQGGTVLSSSKLASTWAVQSSPSGDDLYGASCSSGSGCVVAGANGTVAATTNGGASWRLEGTGTTDELRAVSCPAELLCYATGEYGSILEIKPVAGQR